MQDQSGPGRHKAGSTSSGELLIRDDLDVLEKDASVPVLSLDKLIHDEAGVRWNCIATFTLPIRIT